MIKILELIANSFKNNPSKMLLITGTIGWVTSSCAQVVAILANKEIPNEQKSFLLSQEISDAIVNILAFVSITQAFRVLSNKLVTTGKIIPKNVKNILVENNLADNIGKFDFNIGEELKSKGLNSSAFDTFKTFSTTSAAIAGSIFSSNIVAPYARNKIAADVQKKYKDLEKQMASENPVQTYQNNMLYHKSTFGLKI